MSKELIDSFAQAVRAIYKDDPSKEQAGIDAARSALETAIEALQARVAELEKVSQDDRACCVSLQKALLSEEAENDALAVELAALKNQEPVATLWRENNQKLYPGLLIDLTATGEALPTGVLHHLFAAPTTPVREPLTDSTIGEIWGFEAGKSGYNVHELPRRFARTIEAAHGIKEQK